MCSLGSKDSRGPKVQESPPGSPSALLSRKKRFSVCEWAYLYVWGVWGGVNVCVHICVVEGNKDVPKTWQELRSEEGNREKSTCWREAGSHTQASCRGKELIKSHSWDLGYGAASDRSLIRTKIVSELTYHEIHSIFAVFLASIFSKVGKEINSFKQMNSICTF